MRGHGARGRSAMPLQRSFPGPSPADEAAVKPSVAHGSGRRAGELRSNRSRTCKLSVILVVDCFNRVLRPLFMVGTETGRKAPFPSPTNVCSRYSVLLQDQQAVHAGMSIPSPRGRTGPVDIPFWAFDHLQSCAHETPAKPSGLLTSRIPERATLPRQPSVHTCNLHMLTPPSMRTSLTARSQVVRLSSHLWILHLSRKDPELTPDQS